MSEPLNPPSQPIIIAGMHRSGTSLTASILQQAGVSIGDQLLEASPGNAKGFFEDTDFLNLHQDILQSQGISLEGWSTVGQLTVPHQFWPRAQALCDRRLQTHSLWGWKEPRTTLFLDFWKQLLPQAKVILPYRSPWEVVDSLFTRGDVAFLHNPNLATAIWLAYNQTVLAFYQRYPDDCFMFHCDFLKLDEQRFVEQVRQKFNLPLTVPNQRLFDPTAMHHQVNQTHRPALLAIHFPETLELYTALQRLADGPNPQSDEATMPTQTKAIYRDWVLQDWLTSNRRRQEIKQLKTQLETVHTHLHNAKTELTHWQLMVESMESNRFWQMRNAWVGLKQRLGLLSEEPAEQKPE
ncbi:MAG: sulfotransferase [Cyanobacteria bacterium P01_F01_bin.56]